MGIMLKHRGFFIALLIGLILFGPIMRVAAQVSVSQDTLEPQLKSKSALAVSPAIVEHVLKPNERKEFKLAVTNLTNFPLPISGTVKNFVTLEEIVDTKKQAMYDASKWFTLSEPDFILQPNQTKEVSISILPPPGAEPGGHYATVYFQPLLPSGVLTESTSYLTARVGTLAFLIVPGAIEEKLGIQKFTTPNIQFINPVHFQLELSNLGNIHLSPNSKVEVYNIFNKKVMEESGRPGIVVPGTHKQLEIALRQSLHVGRYTAVVTTAFGAQKKELQRTVTFWVIPWTFVVLIVCAVLVLLVVLKGQGRWKKAWHILLGKDKPSI